MKILGQVKMPGLPSPINVVSQEDAEQCEWVVCMLVEDMPELTSPDSIKEECSRCKRPIWFNQRTSPHRPPKICMHCLTKVDPNEIDGYITPLT